MFWEVCTIAIPLTLDYERDMEITQTRNRTKTSNLSKNSWETRKQLRYRFATLLTEGRFDSALQEARQAHNRMEILNQDLNFVESIVIAAQKLK